MSEEFKQYDTNRFSEETRQLLATGISAMAAQESMGLSTDANSEIRRREAAELAADMERKNKENQLRRAAAVTGSLPDTPATADQKPKLKGRRKKTIPKQEPSKIMPASHIPEQPTVAPQSPVQQSQLPPGLTEADLALIEQVKASRNRAVGNFLDSHDTVHPNAYDARPMQAQMPQEQNPVFAQQAQFNQVQTHMRQPPEPAPLPPQYSYVPPQVMQPHPPVQQPQAFTYIPPQSAPQPIPEESSWDNEIDPDAVEEEQEDMPEVEVPERNPLVEPTVVHAVSPAPFDPGVPDRDFSAFSEITGFPTKGLFYSDRLFGQGLTTVDADMLSAMDPDDPLDVANTFTAILGRRIRGINPEDILSADEECLVYWLRESTYLTESLPKVKFKCEHCGTYVTEREQLDMLGRLGFSNQEFVTEKDPAEVAAMHAAEGFVRYTMFDGRECAIYLRRRKHDRAIAEYMDGWEKANRKIYPVYRAFNTSIASFVEIEDCDTMSEKIKFLEEYPLSKRKDFLKAVYDAQVVSKTFINVKCPKCGGVAHVPYSFQSASFVASLR